MRQELESRGFELTECRLLDIYLWAYSGTYEPLWRRRQTGSAKELPIQGHEKNTSAQHLDQRGPAGQTAEPVEVRGIERFWRDDTRYLRWLRSHDAGYVVNCEHEPKEWYLKLHRTDCPHLNLRNVRSWTDPYMKVCASEVLLLDQWAIGAAGRTPDRCPVCKP